MSHDKSSQILYLNLWQSCCHLQHVCADEGTVPGSASRAQLQMMSSLFGPLQVTASSMEWTKLLPEHSCQSWLGSWGVTVWGCRHTYASYGLLHAEDFTFEEMSVGGNQRRIGAASSGLCLTALPNPQVITDGQPPAARERA